MSLIRQVWLLVLGTILFALMGSVVSSIWSAHHYLETQLTLKNSDNAQSLALTLSQQGGDTALMELVVSAQFDIGNYASIRLIDSAGRVLTERHAEPIEIAVPAWFTHLVSIKATPGVAQVSSGWSALGRVEVISQPVFAYLDLWRGAWRTVLWMLAVGGVAALIAHLAVRRLRVPLDAAVAQAQALTQRRYLSIVEPKTPELREMTRAMNLMVERVRAQFSEQALLVDALRLRANGDALTGLSHRAHFLAGLEAQLIQDDPPAPGQLVLIRVLRLAELNQRLGHHATDEMLRALAARIERTAAALGPHLAGRLNGSDFAVLFTQDGPLGLQADELMAQVRDELARHAGISAVLAAVRVPPGDAVAAVLSAADAGLARAEARGDFEAEVVEQVDALAQAGGQTAWRE
ncbi:MAG: LapD/MoxY N-terminal periplasmic domain-containing protein, partial [Leptothrix sp. (in: b-proteobacteria)]